MHDVQNQNSSAALNYFVNANTLAASTMLQECQKGRYREHYPSICCELLHVRNAILVALCLQAVSVAGLSLLYLSLEVHGFIVAVDVFRPAIILIVIVNVIGILTAIVGIALRNTNLVFVQISLLTALVVIADLAAFSSVFIMAFGSKFVINKTDEHQQRNPFITRSIQSFFVNEERFESILGPFWIYLIAILFHLGACTLVCFIAVHRKYCKFVEVRTNLLLQLEL